MKHLLVTNDFPPKHGGIQTYLWELWRRLPPDEVTVLTTPFAGAEDWDRGQAFRVVRSRSAVLLPTPDVRRQIDALADEVGAELVLLDPALPLGAIGPSLARPYGLVLHGAEVTVPGRVPLARRALRRTLLGAKFVIAAGGYPADEAELAAGRGLPVVVVPPGVDTDRFTPLDAAAREAARARFGLPLDAMVVAAVSRLVPRKGFDTVIRAAARLAPSHPHLVVVIAGDGRDRGRLERLVRTTGAPVRFLGRVPDDDLPAAYGCADLFAMVCRNRWFGLEQEGFGIVFLEAAACGVAQIAGRSGGADEAVVDGTTGLVVDPHDEVAVAGAIARLLDDPETRDAMGRAARTRARDELAYDSLAEGLRRLWTPSDVGDDRREDPPGATFMRTSDVVTVVFSLVAIVSTIALEEMKVVVVAVSLVLFAAGCVAFLWAYAVAVNRSRTDAIGIGGLFFLQDSAPRPVQVRLLGALAVQVVVAFATAAVHPFTSQAFVVLAPMFGLGMAGLWGARYGHFDPRQNADSHG